MEKNHMKYKTLSFFLMVFLFMLSTFSMANAANPAYMTDTQSQCSVPTVHVFVTGGPGEVYNNSKITVPQSTCVEFTFHNAGTLDHTFSINAVKSDNVTYFNIYLTPNQTASRNFWTPSVNKDYKFFCQVPGHEAAGMYGTLIVGKGSTSKSSPGFTALPVFLGLGAFATIVAFTKIKRRHQ